MYWNEIILQELIDQDYLVYLFSDQQLQQPRAKYILCCGNQNLIDDNGANTCQSCVAVNSIQAAKKYLDFHENKNSKS